MSARFVLVAASLAIAALWGVSCRTPTEMIVTVTTDFDCSELAKNEVAARFGVDFRPQGPAQSVSLACNARNAGKVVVTPSGKGDQVTIEVSAAIAPGTLDSNDNCAEGAVGCIHARRSLLYLSNTALDIPIVLEKSCAAHLCLPTETCRAGSCVPNAIDSRQCAKGPCTLPMGMPDGGADGGSGYPLLPECDPTTTQAGAPYPTPGGCTGRTNTSPELGPATAPTKEMPFSLSGVPLETVIDRDNVLYVTSDDGWLYAIELSSVPPKQRWRKQYAPGTVSGYGGAPLLGSDDILYVTTDDQMMGFRTSDGAIVRSAVGLTRNIASDLVILPNPAGRIVFEDVNGGVQSMDTIPMLAAGPGLSIPYLAGNTPTVFQGQAWVTDKNGNVVKLDGNLMPGPLVQLPGNNPAQLANAPDGNMRALLSFGTTWRVVAFDKNASTIWQHDVPGNLVKIEAITHDGTAHVFTDIKAHFAVDANGVRGPTTDDTDYAGYDVAANSYTMNSGVLISRDGMGNLRWKSNWARPINAFQVAKGGILVGVDHVSNSVWVYAP